MRNSKAFTLLELIIVVIVIGILVAMILPQFQTVVERGRVAKAKGALDAIRKAEGLYKTIYGSYINDDFRHASGILLSSEVPELYDINARDLDWDYGVVTTAPGFLAKATRADVGHPYGATNITVDQVGVFDGTHPYAQ